MLSGSVCQMGQEAGLAGVAAAGLESDGESPALLHWAQQEELGICGSHFSLPAPNLGHSFEGRLLSLLNPSAVHPSASSPFVRESGRSCLATHHPIISHWRLAGLLWVSEDRMSFQASATLHVPFPLLGLPFLSLPTLLLSARTFFISLPEISAFTSPRAFPPQFSFRSHFTFLPRAGVLYYTYTLWQFIGDWPAPTTGL